MFKELIEKIDEEIQNLKQDTNRGVMALAELLVGLAKEFGEAKSNYTKLETTYETEYILKKEEREKQIKVSNELILDEKKKEKITDAELKRYADSMLIKEYKDMREYKANYEYLEPIVKAYDNVYTGYKSDRNLLIRNEKKYNSFNP